MHRIAVIGAGYVGLTTAVGFAHLGHQVWCTDIEEKRVARLREGKAPIVEEGLEELIRDGIAASRLSFGVDNVEAVREAEFTFLCVPTPQGDDGRADMSYIQQAAREIGPHLASKSVVVNKSTVPVGSARVVEAALGRDDVFVVSNPEFLREGSAIHDFLFPDRIVIGADSEEVAVRVSGLFLGCNAPIIITDPPTAETIKYASNAFLATKVSFINAIAALCEAVGADVRRVKLGMGMDPRIGSQFLSPGPGWGGSCFPKDTAALVRIAEDAGYDFGLLKGAIEVNEEQYERVTDKVVRIAGGSVEGVTIAQWGLAFKAGTDDVRSSPAIELAHRLVKRGAQVRAYDPGVSSPIPLVQCFDNPYEACAGASVLLVATEWNEFRWLDFERVASVMKQTAVLDARNLLDPEIVRRAGLSYEGIGLL